MSNKADDIRTKVQALMTQAKTDLATMVAFKSVFAPADSPPPDCDKMVEWLSTTLTAEGFVDVATHVTLDKSKAVTARKAGPKGAPTVLLYFHHDVQPVPNDNQDWPLPPTG